MDAALLRLFNAVWVDDDQQKDYLSQETLERTIKNGYLLHPSIQPTDARMSMVESIIGISGEKANTSFHKSWAVVRDTPMEILVIQQIFHYITTYGFDALGIYDEASVYIPYEELSLPEIQEDIPLIFVKAMTEGKILDAILDLASGIALHQNTLDDLMTVITDMTFNEGFVREIKNRELKALLYDYYGLVPTEPVEFLGHLVSKLTGESLLIKNDYLIEKIKESSGDILDALLEDAPANLASIFFRYKPLFLAMKSVSRNKTFFNRLRKQANKLHEPLPQDYLNSVTMQIKHGKISLVELARHLDSASIFRKIRLAYALSFRLNAPDAIVYRVRNGRGWATNFDWPDYDFIKRDTRTALDMTLDSIGIDIQKNVEGKTIYIPLGVNYALPATEKQFTGHLPNGSYVSVPEDLIVGIHWTNTGRRVDLDLSVIDETGKIGWDARYRSQERDVLFSGDMTDARKPLGASELFYIEKGSPSAKILMVNYYNFSNDEVQCKILAAKETPRKFDRNYMVNIGNIMASANINISRKQNVLGLIVNVDGENRVYFANVSVGNSISSYSYRDRDVAEQSRKYLIASLVNSIDFRHVLESAGVNIIDYRPDDTEYLDLSPEALDKTTIIGLMK